MSDVIIEFRSIHKRFGGIHAVRGVSFSIEKGEVHTILGENGAGKSTLIKVLTGVYAKDGGEVHIEGVDGPAVIRSPQDAQNAGISTVYQEITLCPNLSVAENMYIGRTKGSMTNWNAMNSGAGKILESLGIPASPTQQLGTCSIAVQQMVAIARAVDILHYHTFRRQSGKGGLPLLHIAFQNVLEYGACSGVDAPVLFRCVQERGAFRLLGFGGLVLEPLYTGFQGGDFRLQSRDFPGGGLEGVNLRQYGGFIRTVLEARTFLKVFQFHLSDV